VARLVYGPMGSSLDGFCEDEAGNFDWAVPSEELHRLANESTRETAAFVFGRRLYEAMEPYWPEVAARDDVNEIEAEFARAYLETPRIVVSDSLESVGEGVRLVRRADAREEIERLKAELDGPVEVAGPTLAGSVVDLLDEFRLWVFPVLVGRGKPSLPAAAEQVDLRLVESRTFEGGVVLLRYERA
jgi:dihydrofolate reductase